MAFWDKYKVEISDVYGLEWTIEIQEDSAAGSTTYLTATGDPLRFEFMSDSDDYNESVRPSKAIFNVYSTTNFALTDFYTDEDFRLKVNVKHGSTLYWTGFVVSFEYSEPYNDTPYPVTITAVDGLNYLKDILYDDSGTYYEGRKRISKIILDILSKISVTSFTEFVNIYEEDMNVTVDDSPFDQAYLDVDIFRDMSCYEVLQAILEPFNAVIRQRLNGTIVIYRPEELLATAYGRTFTGETTKSSTTISPDQFISRSTKTDLKQLSGGALMIKGALKKITTNQDFGYKESWIDNWELKPDSSGVFTSWTEAASTGAKPILAELGEGTDGAYLDSYDTSAPFSYYIEQEFGDFTVEDLGTNYVFEVEFLAHNTGAGTVSSFDVGVMIKQGDHYVSGSITEGSGYDPFFTWVSPAIAYASYSFDALVGSSGWKTFKINIGGPHEDGPVTVRLIASSHADVRVAYRNAKFYNYSATLAQQTQLLGYRLVKTDKYNKLFAKAKNRVKEQAIYGSVAYEKQQRIVRKIYESTNAVNGKEVSLNFIVGDVLDADTGVGNIVEQFAGSIGKPDFDYRVDTITLTGGGSGDIAIITCNNETQECEWDTDRPTTAAKFVTDHAAQYASVEVTVTSSGSDIIFTNDVLGEEFIGDTTITPDVGTLDGTVELTTPARPDDKISQTEVWNTRGGSEADPLLEIITAEIGNQYSRPKQLIQMNIKETDPTAPVLNIIGNVQDSLNQIGGVNRKFVFNAGEFNVKQRLWNADLIELIYTPSEYDLVDLDGNVYTTVTINGQEWIVENFRCSKYSNGNSIAYVTDDATWMADTSGAYCWFDDDTGNKDTLGALYNWFAVNGGLAYLERNGVQESGWRIATNSDLVGLYNYTSDNANAIKESGTTYWNSGNNGTNSTGFSFRGAGQRLYQTGAYNWLKIYGWLWASDSYDTNNAYALYCFYNNDFISAGVYANKGYGHSVRLVRDV